MTNYSNPRLTAEISDWPLGRGKRGVAIFYIESVPGRGQRAIRTTGGAPKKLTYACQARLVDGDDGRTYIAELTMYGHVSIMKGDMKFQHEVLREGDSGYAAARALFC